MSFRRGNSTVQKCRKSVIVACNFNAFIGTLGATSQHHFLLAFSVTMYCITPRQLKRSAATTSQLTVKYCGNTLRSWLSNQLSTVLYSTMKSYFLYQQQGIRDSSVTELGNLLLLLVIRVELSIKSSYCYWLQVLEYQTVPGCRARHSQKLQQQNKIIASWYVVK